MEERFKQLFDSLKAKGLDTTMLEIRFRIYQKSEKILSSDCQETEYAKWREKKFRCRTYLKEALSYLHDFEIINVEEYIELIMML